MKEIERKLERIAKALEALAANTDRALEILEAWRRDH